MNSHELTKFLRIAAQHGETLAEVTAYLEDAEDAEDGEHGLLACAAEERWEDYVAYKKG